MENESRGVLGLLDRISDLGPAAQASIPGLYAWAITVAPSAWAREAGWPADVTAVLALAVLAAAPVLERAQPLRARVLSVWGFTVTSLATWLLVPSALSPSHLDVVRAVAGVVGWALFATASAAPALPRLRNDDRVTSEGRLRPRSRFPRGDTAFIAVGVALAAALELVGWRVVAEERAVLVRLVAIACGLAMVGAWTSFAVSRHGRRAPAPLKVRLRRSLPYVVVLVLLVIAGVVIRLA